MKQAPKAPFAIRARAWCVLALTCAFVSVSPQARAALRRFGTLMEENQVTAGVPFRYVIMLETDGEAPETMPTEPTWGGLKIVEGPATSQRFTIINGDRRLQVFVQYVLVAEEPGQYTIGHSRIEVNGEIYESGTETVTAGEPDMSMFPESLRDREILHPVTDDPGITRQLQGRAFVLPELSTETPYVGEPFSVTYYFYQERLPRAADLQVARPTAKSMLEEEPYIAQSISPTEIVTLDGRDYDVALLYRNVFTPTRPGRYRLEDFGIRFRLPVQSANRRRPRSRFDSFFDLDPAFSPMVAVEARAPALSLEVRPIPSEGRPKGFSGTVGDFDLSAKVDHTAATEDDLITLRARIDGRGNPSLASPPDFPENQDFELFDQTEETERKPGRDEPAGTKTVEYLLRPKRSGTLEVPALRYPIFNPKSEGFEILTTEPQRVQVAPSRVQAVQAEGEATDKTLPEIEDQLDYLKPLIGLRRAAPRALYHSPLYWAAQIAALALACAALVSARRRETVDPAEQRRRNAWAALDLRLKSVTEAAASKTPEEAANALERALREFIADWFNVKAEGLTAPEISFRLMAEGISKENMKRIEAIMEECAQARYAPLSEQEANFPERAREARTILRQELKG